MEQITLETKYWAEKEMENHILLVTIFAQGD